MLRLLPFLLAPGLLLAQIPRVGVVDFYGLRKTSPERVAKAVGVQAGDRLPASKAVLEDRLEKLPDVVLARVEGICCINERAVLYVGIEERGAPHFEFREPPTGPAALPDDILELYQDYLRAFERAARQGQTGEDLSLGHPRADNAAVRALQDRFTALADAQLPLLREVLRDSRDGYHRAVATAIIGYTSSKPSVIKDLQFAMQDPEESVRANAMRALAAVATLSRDNPDPTLRVEATWFVELLHSIVWSDRYRAAQALVAVTARRPENVLEHLRRRALTPLLEMARWKTAIHAAPAFILAGRIAGVPDQEIEAEWERGDRESVLKQLEKGR